MGLSYTSLHWGTKPKRVTNARCAVGMASSVGRIKACSYVTVKAGEHDIYRHVFENDTDLYKLDKNGEYELIDCPKNVIAIGRALDFEMASGERLLIGGNAWFVTNKEGSHVWLVGDNMPYGLEYSANGLFVTDHGIEG